MIKYISDWIKKHWIGFTVLMSFSIINTISVIVRGYSLLWLLTWIIVIIYFVGLIARYKLKVDIDTGEATDITDTNATLNGDIKHD